MSGRIISPLQLAAAALLAFATPAVAGPPWISIELPASPWSSLPRDAFVLVHTYHHFTPVPVTLFGTAEGLVGGERRSIPLAFDTTSALGVYAVRRQWPAEGVWVLRIVLNEDHGTATAVVGIGSSGEVNLVRVPTGVGHAPRPVSDGEIGGLLRSLAAGRAAAPFAAGLAGELNGRLPSWLVGGVLLAGVPFGLVLWRRRRAALAAAALLLVAFSSPALACPPQISIERPAAMSPDSAFLLVHAARGCGFGTLRVIGTAEGLVGGARRSIPLEVAATTTDGVYRVRRQWPGQGVWVLRLVVRVGDGSATALVGVNASGEIATVLQQDPGRRTIPNITDADVDAMLRSLAQ